MTIKKLRYYDNNKNVITAIHNLKTKMTKYEYEGKKYNVTTDQFFSFKHKCYFRQINEDQKCHKCGIKTDLFNDICKKCHIKNQQILSELMNEVNKEIF